MRLEVRQKVLGGIAMMLLMLFFIILYGYITTGMERHVLVRLKALASYSAAIIEDRVSSYSEATELIVSLAGPSLVSDHTFTNVIGIKTDALHAHATLLIDGEKLMYFDKNGGMAVLSGGKIAQLWCDALARAVPSVRMEGPLPSLKNDSCEIVFTHELASASGDRYGALALAISLDTLETKLDSIHSHSLGGRKYYLADGRGRVLLPSKEKGVQPFIQNKPLFAAIDEGRREEKTAKVTFEGITYYTATADVATTGWQLYVLSPVDHEMSFRPLLTGSFAAGWFCLCGFVFLLMHQARRQDHYKVLSELDHLTGAGNRLAFEKSLVRLEKEDRFPACLIVMDVDGLKLLNDSLGHEAGDALLRRVTQLLQRSLRENDSIFRIGGDEFAVIIQGAAFSIAEPMVERINLHAALMREKTTLPPVFISLGMAEAKDADSLATLFARADEAMYNNKKLRKEAATRAILKWIREHPDQIAERADS